MSNRRTSRKIWLGYPSPSSLQPVYESLWLRPKPETKRIDVRDSFWGHSGADGQIDPGDPKSEKRGAFGRHPEASHVLGKVHRLAGGLYWRVLMSFCICNKFLILVLCEDHYFFLGQPAYHFSTFPQKKKMFFNSGLKRNRCKYWEKLIIFFWISASGFDFISMGVYFRLPKRTSERVLSLPFRQLRIIFILTWFQNISSKLSSAPPLPAVLVLSFLFETTNNWFIIVYVNSHSRRQLNKFSSFFFFAVCQ